MSHEDFDKYRRRCERNYNKIPVSCDEQDLWDLHLPTSSSPRLHLPTSSSPRLHVATSSSTRYMLDDLTRFGVVSSLLLGVNPGRNPHLENIHMNTFERGGSSVAKKKHASDYLKMQIKENEVKEYLYTNFTNYLSKQQKEKSAEWLEDEVKEDVEANNQYKQARERNENEKVRSQKSKEKLRTLRQLIPNCSWRDKLSILDEAIKYIKALQYQVYMMSLGASLSAFHSPMLRQQSGQQRMQLPTTNLPSFPQTNSPQEMNEMEYENETYPTSRLGLPNSCFMSSSATSTVSTPGGIQNSVNFLKPPSMDWMQLYAISSGLHSGTQEPSGSRVLPSKVVPPRFTKDMDRGSSHSTSSERPSNSNAK